MKVVSLLVFILAIYTIESSVGDFNDKSCLDYKGLEPEKQAFSKDFCRSLGLSDSTKKCCYVRYKQNDKSYYNCVELTLEQFYDMKTTKTVIGKELGGDVKSLVCNSSSYLYNSLFLLLIALL